MKSNSKTLASRVRDLATLFEVGKSANAALELDELFPRNYENPREPNGGCIEAR